MLDRARKSAQEHPPLSSSLSRRPPAASRNSPDYNRGVSEGGVDPVSERNKIDGGDDDDDEDEDYGPSLPRFDPRTRGGPSSGPTIPTMQDLDLRKGMLLTHSLTSFLSPLFSSIPPCNDIGAVYPSTATN